LLKIMQMTKAPMKYMKVLQKWAQDCSWNNVFEGDALPPGRNETLKSLRLLMKS
jgi:hypothetical protein